VTCIRELKERLAEEAVGAFEIALVYAGLGKKDLVFEWLEGPTPSVTRDCSP
jgi:hypothetical protein